MQLQLREVNERKMWGSPKGDRVTSFYVFSSFGETSLTCDVPHPQAILVTFIRTLLYRIISEPTAEDLGAERPLEQPLEQLLAIVTVPSRDPAPAPWLGSTRRRGT